MNSELAQLEQLEELLKDMDIPQFKRQLTGANLHWLKRNLHSQNRLHENFPAALALIKAILAPR
jgi:hypothetical protein